jgi:hypothetical protein
MRVKFRKGFQRKFLDEVIIKLNSPSLRGLLQFGFDTSYSSLKKYYNELRLMPEKIFSEMKTSAGLEKNFRVKFFEDNWGKVKGGKK